ncbi:universal stress protein [Solicola sp. PLA-1-18]|jgi:nucleotide-binding universal stress UspA family protein|uniref:universal stress protein n=1 Tax=Solicola sp. PLA-1-18 TaxID=3380532 RepID=UPI003B80DF0B
MTVLTVVTDSPEGRHALVAGAEEATLLGTDLLVANLTLSPLDTSGLAADLEVTVVDRHGGGDRDPVRAVLDEVADHPDVDRLVICVRRRSPVGKALLGSISQQLLLDSPVPVLAVKIPA